MYWHECKPDIPIPGKDIDMSGMRVDPDLYTGRSDWDPWEIIQKDDIIEEHQEGIYIYDTSKLDMSNHRDQDFLELFDEEESTEGTEEETEQKENKRQSTKKEEFGEEEDDKSDNQGEYQEIVD